MILFTNSRILMMEKGRFNAQNYTINHFDFACFQVLVRWLRCKPGDPLHCLCALLPCWPPVVVFLRHCVTWVSEMGVENGKASQYHGRVLAGQ